jgi:hypothetical protein
MRGVGARRTRIVSLEDGQDRREAQNLRTGVVLSDESRGAGRGLPFRELFTAAWSEMRRVVQAFDQPGIAVVAVDSIKKRVAGSMCLAAKQGRANAAIVGRHGQCDLYLHADPALSLRHMVVLVHPLKPGGEVAYRAIDLRTRTAFADEGGRRLEAVTAEGPMFLQVGGYALYFLVTGDEGGWPDDADQAWQCIPERVYLEEAIAEPDRWRRRRRHMPLPVTAPGNHGSGDFAAGTGVGIAADVGAVGAAAHRAADRAGRPALGSSPVRDSITLVRTQTGPARAQVDRDGGGDDDGSPPLGTLKLSSGGRSQAMTLGHDAASAGVLLGRYDRCDAHGATVFAHHGISRVHLLVVEVEGAVYAVDTGSTNGTYQGSDEVRIVPLAGGTELIFGDGLARMEWMPP